tara:strand:- start:804 stop:1094 length:291 start_codon:yes stop_codon:yes gene_type:complete
MEKLTPWQILFKGRPDSRELELCMDHDYEWWGSLTPEEVIQEVKEIRDRYSEGSGWVQAEEIEGGSQSAIEERNDLRKVVTYIKRKYKKFYLKGGK